MVHAMDEAVGLETVRSLATRYGALAAVNSGYFRTTGTYRGDSVGVEVLNGKLLSEPDNVRAAAGSVERGGKQDLIFGHIKLDGQLVAGARAKHAIDGLNRPRGDNELVIFTPEFHRTSFVTDYHPRTAIAKLKSGQILLVTVDGRQPGESIGMSLTMLADLLLEFGAVEAINLDGGGSTTMVIKNKLVDKPSDATGERPVSDAILVYPR
jgi:exopolysaccharide biosynthesis protein